MQLFIKQIKQAKLTTFERSTLTKDTLISSKLKIRLVKTIESKTTKLVIREFDC